MHHRPGKAYRFANAYAKFIEKVTINQSSESLIVNYGRSLVYVALHVNRSLHRVSVDEMWHYVFLSTRFRLTFKQHQMHMGVIPKGKTGK